jgi:hemerythrin
MSGEFSRDIGNTAQSLKDKVALFQTLTIDDKQENSIEKESSWGPEYMLDIPTIDEQHMVIFALAARMKQAVANHEDIFPIINAMDEYARWHLSFEEQALAEFSWPGLADHRQLHKDLRRDLENFSKQSGVGEQNIQTLKKELPAFVANWLKEHINVHDRVYGEWLKSNVDDLNNKMVTLVKE